MTQKELEALEGAKRTKDMQAKLAYARAFAKALKEQKVHDPSGKSSRRASVSYSTNITRESIDEWLTSPTSNEKNLRNASIYLYQTSSRYRNLLQYYANLPCWLYTIGPANYNPDKIKPDTFKKQYQRVSNLIESMNLPSLAKLVTITALREGAFYGAIWGGDGSSFILQKLNPDNCQIVSVTDGNVFRFVYDMSKIKETDLATYYPPAFTDMYNEYKKGGSQYQLVPIECSMCVKGDESIAEYSIPPFSAVMPGIFNIQNIEDLSETATELSNYKLISGKLPTDSDGSPLLDYKTAMNYYEHIANNVGDRVGVAVSPFDLKSFDFDQSAATAQVDSVARANENFFAAAGTSAHLHGAANSTSGTTKLAINVDESFAFGLMSQFEKVINRFLKSLPGTIKFKTTFLPVSIFNKEDMLAQYKNGLNYGIGKLQYAVCLGIAQHSIGGQSYIENEILKFDEMFTPMKMASTQSTTEEGAGRPTQTNVTEEGEKTRDSDANANR